MISVQSIPLTLSLTNQAANIEDVNNNRQDEHAPTAEE